MVRRKRQEAGAAAPANSVEDVPSTDVADGRIASESDEELPGPSRSSDTTRRVQQLALLEDSGLVSHFLKFFFSRRT